MSALLAGWLLLATPALAAGPVSGTEQLGEGLIPNLPPGPAPAAETVDDTTHAIARTLRCPVCQGMSVADSTSEAAVMFQSRIRELVKAGYTDAQIRDYFVDRYGEWILLDPQSGGMNAILYLVPALLLGVGGVWVAGTITTWRKEPDDVPLPSDAGLVPMDDYEKRLLQELDE